MASNFLSVEYSLRSQPCYCTDLDSNSLSYRGAHFLQMHVHLDLNTQTDNKHTAFPTLASYPGSQWAGTNSLGTRLTLPQPMQSATMHETHSELLYIQGKKLVCLTVPHQNQVLAVPSRVEFFVEQVLGSV